MPVRVGADEAEQIVTVTAMFYITASRAAGLLSQASSLLDLRASGNRLGSLLHFLGVGIIGKGLPHSVRFFNKGDFDSEDPGVNWRFAHQGKIATPGPKAIILPILTTT
jgi:hypothetical protein